MIPVEVRFERRLAQPRRLSVAVPIASLAVAFLAGAAVLGATGHDPVATYRKLVDSAFFASGAIEQTLIAMTPLLFTGLAAAVAFRIQLFNIGAEGQLLLGTVGASGIALVLGNSGQAFQIVAMVAAGALFGLLWSLIPALLRAYAKTNEIITSLMLNYVASLFLTYLIFDSLSYWRDTSTPDAQVFPSGKILPDDSFWPVIELGSLSVPFGLVLGLVVVTLAWVLYSRTRFGFEARVIGDSPRAARYAGMRTRRKILAVMGLSGAIAGIGGASQMGDFRHQLDPRGLDQSGYGYAGIVIAALARYNPFAVALVAFLLGGLQNAGFALQGSDFPAGLVGILQGLILFSTLGGELFVRYRVRLARRLRGAGSRGAEASG